ncbi:MAG: menaquinone-dependent protoporphyrinogen IX dehydrogenase [Bradyrhizobium sp.]
MARVLIVYSTTDGHTREICNRLRRVIEQQAHQVSLVPVADADEDLEAFDKIVVGASIRYGKHRPEAVAFIERNAQLLNGKPSAFFSVSVVARKPAKNRPHTNPYVRKLLRRIAWRPREVGVFAGKIDYPRYDFLDRMVIRFIMWLTGGPTDPKTVVEFTDWRQVEAFGNAVARM